MILGHVSGGKAAAEAVAGLGAGVQQSLNLAIGRLAQSLMSDFIRPRLGPSAANPDIALEDDGETIAVLVGASGGAKGPSFAGPRRSLRLRKKAWKGAMASPRIPLVRPKVVPEPSAFRAGFADFEASGAFKAGVDEAIGGVIL